MTAKAKFGSDWTIIESYTDGYATTAPVGVFTANALGIYDLGGNQWEWTSSLYEAGGEFRVLRGGSWFYFAPASLLSSFRFNLTPAYRFNFLGFRCLLVVSGG